MTSSWMCNGEISKQYTTSSSNRCSKNESKYTKDEICFNANNIAEKKDIEVQISILPYYGLIDTKICTVKKHLDLIKILRKTYCINNKETYQ